MNNSFGHIITKLQNSQRLKQRLVTFKASPATRSILLLLQKEGYIRNFYESDETYNVLLKYHKHSHKPVLEKFQRISKPGCRKYISIEKIRSTLNRSGISILSTNKGLLSSEQAAKQGIGGEHIYSSRS